MEEIIRSDYLIDEKYLFVFEEILTGGTKIRHRIDITGEENIVTIKKGAFVDPKTRLFNGAIVPTNSSIVIDREEPCDLHGILEAVAPCDLRYLADRVDIRKVTWICPHCRRKVSYYPMEGKYLCRQCSRSNYEKISSEHGGLGFPQGGVTYSNIRRMRGEVHNTFSAMFIPGLRGYWAKLMWLSEQLDVAHYFLHMGRCEDEDLMRAIIKACIDADPWCHRDYRGREEKFYFD